MIRFPLTRIRRDFHPGPPARARTPLEPARGTSPARPAAGAGPSPPAHGPAPPPRRSATSHPPPPNSPLPDSGTGTRVSNADPPPNKVPHAQTKTRLEGSAGGAEGCGYGGAGQAGCRGAGRSLSGQARWRRERIACAQAEGEERGGVGLGARGRSVIGFRVWIPQGS